MTSEGFGFLNIISSSNQIKTIKVHDFIPGSDKVIYELSFSIRFDFELHFSPDRPFLFPFFLYSKPFLLYLA
jgi:hypothetical protein